MRCLVDLAIVDAVAPENALAEKLGGWIHFTDAISLSAVHNDSLASMPATRRSIAATAIENECNRIQAGLVESITNSCSLNPGNSGNSAHSHIRLPSPLVDMPFDPATAYAPYRRFFDAHQRDMELRLQPLRVSVRAALANVSPHLAKLAELDAVFERILRDRERHLLATVPMLLKKRFDQLYVAHQQWLLERQLTDNPAGWTRSGGWLARFCDDLRMLLLAELELRLQPTMGLLEAFHEHTQKTHKPRNE